MLRIMSNTLEKQQQEILALRAENAQMKHDIKTAIGAIIAEAKNLGVDITDEKAMENFSVGKLLPKLSMKYMTGQLTFSEIGKVLPSLIKYKDLIQ